MEFTDPHVNTAGGRELRNTGQSLGHSRLPIWLGHIFERASEFGMVRADSKWTFTHGCVNRLAYNRRTYGLDGRELRELAAIVCCAKSGSPRVDNWETCGVYLYCMSAT